MEENKIKPPKLPSEKAVKQQIPKQKPVEQKELVSTTINEKNPVLVTQTNTKRVIVLVALFLVAIILATTLFAIVLPKPSSPIDIYIDFQVEADINIAPEYNTGVKKLMPGDTFDGRFLVSTASVDEENQDSEVFVRVAIFATIDGRVATDIFQLNPSGKDWILGADGFFYMYGTLKANEMVEIVSNIVLNKNLDNSYQGKRVALTFVGECLQAGPSGFSAIEAEWKEAPTQWKQSQREIEG